MINRVASFYFFAVFSTTCLGSPICARSVVAQGLNGGGLVLNHLDTRSGNRLAVVPNSPSGTPSRFIFNALSPEEQQTFVDLDPKDVDDLSFEDGDLEFLSREFPEEANWVDSFERPLLALNSSESQLFVPTDAGLLRMGYFPEIHVNDHLDLQALSTRPGHPAGKFIAGIAALDRERMIVALGDRSLVVLDSQNRVFKRLRTPDGPISERAQVFQTENLLVVLFSSDHQVLIYDLDEDTDEPLWVWNLPVVSRETAWHHLELLNINPNSHDVLVRTQVETASQRLEPSRLFVFNAKTRASEEILLPFTRLYFAEWLGDKGREFLHLIGGTIVREEEESTHFRLTRHLGMAFDFKNPAFKQTTLALLPLDWDQEPNSLHFAMGAPTPDQRILYGAVPPNEVFSEGIVFAVYIDPDEHRKAGIHKLPGQVSSLQTTSDGRYFGVEWRDTTALSSEKEEQVSFFRLDPLPKTPQRRE